MPIAITTNDLQLILNQASSAYPEECCGLLLGVDGNVRSIYRAVPTRNTSPEARKTRYVIDAKELALADDQARRSSTTVLGIYHSHPDSPAMPSQFDLEHAWPWYSYIIVSLENGQAKDISAWYLSDDRSSFHLDDLRVLDV